MNKLGNFLWRLFSAIMIFSYHDASFAECSKIKFTEDTTNPATKTLCGKGYYLYSCNSIVLGTQWLRGITTDEEGCNVPSRYSYAGNTSTDASDVNNKNMENLRKFFSGQTVSFGAVNKNTQTGFDSFDTATSSETQTESNIMLSLFCTDDNGKPTEYKCEPCPGIATVKESTVQTDGYNGPVIWNTWNIHTIADCYMKEFSDQFGTYVYKENNTAQDCKYSTHVPGERPLSTTKKSKTTNNTNGS